MFGGGRNQQNGTECFDGWGGSAGKEVLLIQRRFERRRQKGISVPTRYFESKTGFWTVLSMIVYRHEYYIKTYL